MIEPRLRRTVPDYTSIVEILLGSNGFDAPRFVARKLVSLIEMGARVMTKAAQYDWGLRAVRAIIAVASKRKLASPEKDEEQVICDAVVETFLARNLDSDAQTFVTLVRAVFAGAQLDLAAGEKEWTGRIVEAMQSSDGGRTFECTSTFVRKCKQLSDALDVRHSTLLLGPAGSGKTVCREMVGAARERMGSDGRRAQLQVHTIDPKACTLNDLYGHMAKNVWNDGILSWCMRTMINDEHEGHEGAGERWLVLDGDIEASWVESLNTVMDDNKMLTLANNERIKLGDHSRLVFEVDSLAYVSPATVSRVGIVALNAYDVGWLAKLRSCLSGATAPVGHSNLELSASNVFKGGGKLGAVLIELIEHIVSSAFAAIRTWQRPRAHSEVSLAETIARVLDALLTSTELKTSQLVSAPLAQARAFLEACVQFATIWGVGGSPSEEATDRQGPGRPCVQFDGFCGRHRPQFDSFWRREFATSAVPVPVEGTVFDYLLTFDPAKPLEATWVPWARMVPAYSGNGRSLKEVVVPTVDMTRASWLTRVLLHVKAPVLLVGSTASSKTVTLQLTARELPKEVWRCSAGVLDAFSSYPMLRSLIEHNTDKRRARVRGPPGGAERLLLLLDDISMPAVDTYGSQKVLCLLRQVIARQSMFSRADHGLTTRLEGLQYMAAMNPAHGTGTISPRLCRLFCPLTMLAPDADAMRHIYGTVLGAHLAPCDPRVRQVGAQLVAAAVGLHTSLAASFEPSTARCHYVWDLRAPAALFGACVAFAAPETCVDPVQLGRLFAHETRRVYRDRLVSMREVEEFEALLEGQLRAHLTGVDAGAICVEPNMFIAHAEVHMHMHVSSPCHAHACVELNLFSPTLRVRRRTGGAHATSRSPVTSWRACWTAASPRSTRRTLWAR